MSAVPAESPDQLIEIDSLREVVQLRERVAQLQTALHTRIVIEQAKGVLMERFGLTPEAAFALLRQAARNNRESLHKIAALVTASPTTPAFIETVRGRS